MYRASWTSLPPDAASVREVVLRRYLFPGASHEPLRSFLSATPRKTRSTAARSATPTCKTLGGIEPLRSFHSHSKLDLLCCIANRRVLRLCQMLKQVDSEISIPSAAPIDKLRPSLRICE